MPSRFSFSRVWGYLGLISLLTIGSWWGFPVPAEAERLTSDLVLIRPGDVILEDVYAAGNKVRVQGRIEGDLLVAALEELDISGEVTGSVMAIAEKIKVSGTVGGSLRGVASEVTVSGQIGDDLVVGSFDLSLLPAAMVGRDAILWAVDAIVDGGVARNLEGNQGTLELGGDIGGNVDITVSNLRARGATVAGDLAYRSSRAAELSADIGGTLVQRRPIPVNIELRGLLIMLRILGWVTTVAVGLFALRFATKRTKRSVLNLTRRPFASLATAVVLLTSPFVLLGVVLGIVFSTPAAVWVPLALVFFPLFFSALLFAIPLLMIATVPVALWVGRLLLRNRSSYASYLVGMLALLVVSFLPWRVGILLILLALWAGLGAWWAPTQRSTKQPDPARLTGSSAHTV